MWRHIERHGPHVDLGVGVHTRDDEKQTYNKARPVQVALNHTFFYTLLILFINVVFKKLAPYCEGLVIYNYASRAYSSVELKFEEAFNNFGHWTS